MQKYKSNITTTSGAAIRNVPVEVLAEDGSQAALFLDREGSVPAANPLKTGADGTFYFYAVNGRYSLRTTVEGVTITDSDVALLMDPQEITVAGPIAEAVAAAEAAAQTAVAAVEDSGIPELVEAAQNAVVDANGAVAAANAAAVFVDEARVQAESAQSAAGLSEVAATAAAEVAVTTLGTAQQLVATNTKALRVYATKALAMADLPNLVETQVADVTADESRAGKRSRYAVQAGALAFVEYGALDDLADPAKGAAMVARGTVSLDSIADLAGVKQDASLRYLVSSYRSGWAATTRGPLGGGEFVWDSLSTAAANGGTVIAVAGANIGRFRRVYGGRVDVLTFGADPYGFLDSTAAIQAAYDVQRQLL